MNKIPQTPFALISGSAGWGIRFPDDLHEPGIQVLERGLAFDTPWGLSENWQVMEFDHNVTVDGKPRQVLNVFSHGWPIDQIDHEAHRKVFWVLGRAGVKKVLSDSTSGSYTKSILPGDYVITSDFLYLNQTHFSVLPGRFQYMCRGKQLVCPNMAATLETVVKAAWPVHARVYGYANRLVTAHAFGPRFDSPAEAHALHLLGADIVNASASPEASNAREIGACFVSGTYVVNYVDGVLPDEWGDLDKVHNDLGIIAVRSSLRAMARIELTDQCGCHNYHKERPSKYRTIGQNG
jgi:5'-methylthioadenosine phosphorylase